MVIVKGNITSVGNTSKNKSSKMFRIFTVGKDGEESLPLMPNEL
jgi:hypothetical protein